MSRNPIAGALRLFRQQVRHKPTIAELKALADEADQMVTPSCGCVYADLLIACQEDNCPVCK